MKLKIRIKWYENVGDYVMNRSIIKTEIVMMNTTDCAKYMENTMIETGFVLIAEYIK